MRPIVRESGWLGKAKTTRSTPNRSTISHRRSGGPSTGRLDIAARRVVGVDEAEDVDPVFGVVEALAGDQSADLTGTDDHSGLGVGRPPVAIGARSCACRGDEDDRDAPERRDLRKARACKVREQCAGHEDPGADGDEMEHADEVVRGGVVCSLLVPVVEAVELGEQEPAGQRQEEQEKLRLARDGIHWTRAGEDDHREEKGTAETDCVSREQHAPE